MELCYVEERDVQSIETRVLIVGRELFPEHAKEERPMKPSRLRRAFTAIAGLTVLLLVLSGCPDPISNLISGQMVDKSAPSLSISAPEDNSEYTQTVTVQLLIGDLWDDFDLVVMAGGCHPNLCIGGVATSNNPEVYTFTAQQGMSYFIVVENYVWDLFSAGQFQVTLSCI